MTTPRLAAVAALVAALAALGLVLAAPVLAQPPAPPAQPQGTFDMTGTVTVAHDVRGEHVGDVVQRTWTFTPQCPTGPCPMVRLVRSRATGSDTLMLHETAPGAYAGAGRFYAPLRCAGRTHHPGELVPFRITVLVTAANGTAASTISATYVNRKRTNLTRCIGLLGHDAARYTGQVVPG